MVIQRFLVNLILNIDISVNWDDIKNVISYSNVIQRDNLLFAKKLDKELVPVALEGDKHVSCYVVNNKTKYFRLRIKVRELKEN